MLRPRPPLSHFSFTPLLANAPGIRYFGTFNLLAIFIILGIGADNIFIFLDAWAQSAPLLLQQGYEPTPLNRMSFAWRRGAQAMLLTSMTTTCSFMANAMSSFGAINTFGVFAGLLVIMNYLAIILFFPTVCLALAATERALVGPAWVTRGPCAPVHVFVGVPRACPFVMAWTWAPELTTHFWRRQWAGGVGGRVDTDWVP